LWAVRLKTFSLLVISIFEINQNDDCVSAPATR
jgi:hypothetical protein